MDVAFANIFRIFPLFPFQRDDTAVCSCVLLDIGVEAVDSMTIVQFFGVSFCKTRNLEILHLFLKIFLLLSFFQLQFVGMLNGKMFSVELKRFC